MNKKYIIFDFDGTLANTNNIIIASWQATFEHFLGYTLPVRDIEATFGEILVNTIGRLIPDAPVNEVVDYYRAYQDSHQQEYEVYVFAGVKELLEKLRERGCLIGVGTSRTAYSFWNYMKKLGIDGYVDEVVTMNDVTSHKPDPETIDAVLVKMMAHDNEPYDSDHGIPDSVRDAALMIGDTKYDIGCANNARVDSVMVGWSHYVDEEAMLAEGFVPVYHIERPEELLELI
ncbi:MAG: HAD hydrolase-like protein [Mogibacterium sp.]|nr:HAD hydrolase-like protein [Mogibacterium sp.]